MPCLFVPSLLRFFLSNNGLGGSTFDFALCPFSLSRKILSLGRFLSNNGLCELTFVLCLFRWPFVFGHFWLCLRKLCSLGQFLSNNGLGELTSDLVCFDDIFLATCVLPLLVIFFCLPPSLCSLGQFLSNNGLGELTFNLVCFDDIFRAWPLLECFLLQWNFSFCPLLFVVWDSF